MVRPCTREVPSLSTPRRSGHTPVSSASADVNGDAAGLQAEAGEGVGHFIEGTVLVAQGALVADELLQQRDGLGLEGVCSVEDGAAGAGVDGEEVVVHGASVRAMGRGGRTAAAAG